MSTSLKQKIAELLDEPVKEMRAQDTQAKMDLRGLLPHLPEEVLHALASQRLRR